MKNDIGNFKALIPFHNYISKRIAPRKACLIRGCEVEDFESLFHRWYMGNILNKNHMSRLDFNGFEKGYFDLVEDLNKINSHYCAIARRNAKKQQLRAIKSFEKKQCSDHRTIFLLQKEQCEQDQITPSQNHQRQQRHFPSTFSHCHHQPGQLFSAFPHGKRLF
jgi:hypothetical protein